MSVPPNDRRPDDREHPVRREADHRDEPRAPVREDDERDGGIGEGPLL